MTTVGCINMEDLNSIISYQFKDRDLSQYSISVLSDDYQNLSQLYLLEVEKRKDLERELSVLRTQSRMLPAQLQEQANLTPSSGEDYNSHFQKKMYELEAQVNTLKDERGELYKTQGKNAQRLLDLTEKIQTYETKVNSMEEEKKKLLTQIQKMSDEIERNTVLLKEKDNSIQFFQDELATCHLELTKTDEKMKVLKQENSSLLQRWLKKMNEEADNMNISNLLNTTFSSGADKSNSDNDNPAKGSNPGPSDSDNKVESSDDKDSDSSSVALIPIPERLKYEIRPHSSEINTIHISEDGQRFATGSVDKTIQVFSTQTGAQQMTLKGALQGIMCVQFNSTGELLLGTSNDNSTRLWSLNTGRVKETLTGHIGKVYAAKFSPNSYRVVSGSHDRTIKLWDLHRSLCTRTTFTFSSCNDVCILDSEGMNVASGHLDHIVRIWDMKSGNCVKELSGIHSAQITSLNITSDGSKLLTNSRDNNIKLIDLRNYGVVQTYKHEDFRVGSNWSKSVISSNQQYVAAGSTDGNVYFWNTLSGDLAGTIEHHSHPIAALAFHPHPTSILTVDKERNVSMWETPKSKIRY